MTTTKYKPKFCDRCGHETEHTFMVFNTHRLISCNRCQREVISKPKENKENPVERSFKIMNMEQKGAGKRKRLGIVTLQVITEESHREPTKSTLQVQYPIWDGDQHMPALVVEHPGMKTISHTDSQKIAAEINKLIQPPKEEETN